MPALARHHVAKVLDLDADKVDVQTLSARRRVRAASGAGFHRSGRGDCARGRWPSGANPLVAGAGFHARLLSSGVPVAAEGRFRQRRQTGGVAGHVGESGDRAGSARALLRRAAPSHRQDHLRRRVRSALRMARRACRARDRRIAGAGRLLALGRPLASGVLHRGLHRRTRRGDRQGPDCVSRRAARAASAASGGVKARRGFVGLGASADACRRRRAARAWRRVARGVRQRGRAGRGSVDRALARRFACIGWSA